MIHTREQLVNKLAEILDEFDCFGEYTSDDVDSYANKIADLIATLNDKDETTWKNIP